MIGYSSFAGYIIKKHAKIICDHLIMVTAFNNLLYVKKSLPGCFFKRKYHPTKFLDQLSSCFLTDHFYLDKDPLFYWSGIRSQSIHWLSKKKQPIDRQHSF